MISSKMITKRFECWLEELKNKSRRSWYCRSILKLGDTWPVRGENGGDGGGEGFQEVLNMEVERLKYVL